MALSAMALASLLGAGVPAHAGEPAPVPDSGLGSARAPMDQEHGSGVMGPLNVESSPCELLPNALSADGQRVMAWLRPSRERADAWELSKPGGFNEAKRRSAVLHCARTTIDAWDAIQMETSCASSEDQGRVRMDRMVDHSLAVHADPSAIILGGSAPSALLSLINAGWRASDLDLWWLCE